LLLAKSRADRTSPTDIIAVGVLNLVSLYAPRADPVYKKNSNLFRATGIPIDKQKKKKRRAHHDIIHHRRHWVRSHAVLAPERNLHLPMSAARVRAAGVSHLGTGS
jgi:hypothetical protein